jgi:hypothetical protein
VITLFRRGYGGSPLHLLALLASFGLAGYVVSRLFVEDAPLLNLAIWFVGAAVGHDAILYPLYAIADVIAHARLFRRYRRPPSIAGVAWINFLRVPVALSGLLLLLWFPLILGGREQAFFAATGLSTDVYLGRWLGITGGLFLGSALLYAMRIGLAARSAPGAPRGPGAPPGPAAQARHAA